MPPLTTLYVEQQSYEDVAWKSLGEADTGPRPVHEVLRVHRDLLLTADAGGGNSTVQHHFTSESATWWLDRGSRHTCAGCRFGSVVRMPRCWLCGGSWRWRAV